MWILLRKNLWMWRPPRSINVYIFALAFAFSLADWFGHFSTGAWVFPCCLTILIAQAGGISAMDVDLKRDNILFLEYLPVRWWQVWVANWIDQLLACLLIVPLLCWHRVLTWTPPGASAIPNFHGDADLGIFQSRWLLPAGLAAGIFFAYSYALLWRTFFKSEKAAMIPTWLGSLIYVMLPLAIPALLMVAPGLWDLWPLLVFQGCVFSICSLIVFAIPPRHWSRKRRFAILGLPLLLTAWTIEMGAVWYTCRRCETLNWSEPELVYTASPASTGDSRWISVDVRSRRSGTHQFLIDSHDGKSVYVGRNMQLLPADSIQPNERLIALPTQVAADWWPVRYPVFTMLPDGSQRIPLFSDGSIHDELGNRFDVYGAAWIANGTRLLVRAGRGRDRHQHLFIADQNGQAVRQFDVSQNYVPYVTDGANRLLIAAPVDSPTQDSPDEHVQYRLYDAASDTDATFELKDRPICFSDDLSRVVCLKSRLENTTIHESVVSVDLPSLATHVLIDESVLPPMPAGEFTARERYHEALPRQTRLSGVTMRDEPLMAFDRAFRHAVLVVDRYEGAAAYMSLVCVDLASGQCRTIVSEAQLGGRGVSSPRQGFDLFGITPDGNTCIYRSGPKLVRVSISDGRAQVTQVPDDSTNNSCSVSPTGRRVLVTLLNRQSQPYKPSWQVLDLGRSSPGRIISDAGYLQWLDDDRLIATRPQGISLINVDTGAEQNLLPPDYKLQR